MHKIYHWKTKRDIYFNGSSDSLGVSVIIVIHPASPKIWNAVVIFGISGIAAVASYLFSGLRNKQIFSKRQILQEKDIYRLYFSDNRIPEADIFELWREVASQFNLSPGKLRPTDRFGHELGGFWITSDGLDELYRLAQKRAQQNGIVVDLSKIHTLEDYIINLSRSKK